MSGATGGIRARDRHAPARTRGAVTPAAALAVMLVVSVVARSPEAETGAPEPAFLQFLGETAGIYPELAAFMRSRDARKAIEDAADGPPPDEAPADPPWDSLDAESQRLLMVERERWSSIEPGLRRMLASGAERYRSMGETERAAAHARFTTWRESPAHVRNREQASWAQFRSLSPAQQQALRDAYRRFLELPAEPRETIGDRWQDMSPEERRRAIHRRQGPKPGTLDKRPCPPC